MMVVFLIFISLSYTTFTTIHELGHALLCILYGSKDVTISGSGTNCDPHPTNLMFTICGFAGGLTSAATALLTWKILRKKIPRWKHTITQLFIPIGIYELLNGIIEGSTMTIYKAFMKIDKISLIILLMNLILFSTTYYYKKEDIKKEAKNLLTRKNKKKDYMLLILLALILLASALIWDTPITIK